MAIPVTLPRQMSSAPHTFGQYDSENGWDKINLASHGFVDGDVVRESADGVFTKAQGDSAANIGVGLSIVKRIDANNYMVCHHSYRKRLTWTAHGHGSTYGTKLYLSTSSAGDMQAGPVISPAGEVYCGYVVDANTFQWEPRMP